MSLPYSQDIIRLKNNNPGNAPDYTESDVITLRRYNGDPLNHTQADDNLELLRRALINTDTNIRYIEQEVTNVQWNENNIKNLFDNSIFTEELTKFLTNNKELITNILISDNVTYEEYINKLTESYFTENFETFFNDTFVTQNISEEFDFRSIINEYFTSPDSAFNDYLNEWYTNVNVVNQIDITEIVRRIQNYVDVQIANAITGFQAAIDTLDANQQILAAAIDACCVDGVVTGSCSIAEHTTQEACEDAGGTWSEPEPIDLTDIINAINTLGVNITSLATNLNTLTNDVAVNTEDIIDLRTDVDAIIAHVNKMSAALQDLSNAVSAGFASLSTWIKNIFTGLVGSIAALGNQISANAGQIAALWKAMGDQFLKLWTEVGKIYELFDDLYTALETIEAQLCEVEVRIAAILQGLNLLDNETISVCEDGSVSEVIVATMPFGGIGNLTPMAKDLENCGGAVFRAKIDAMASDDPVSAMAREVEIQEEDNATKRAAMRDFNRTKDLVTAVNDARKAGFTFPEINKFISIKLGL